MSLQPYITKTYFGMDNPPVNLVGIAIGDGTMTSIETFEELPVVSVLETYPQIIGYDIQVFEYFQEQCVEGGEMRLLGKLIFPFRSALCGYNLTLEYPQPEHFPTLDAPIFSYDSGVSASAKLTKGRFMLEAQDRLAAKLGERGDAFLEDEERLHARHVWKRDLTGRANGTIDPWYQCDLYSEMLDYAINFTFPWCAFPFIPIPFGLSFPDFLF